MTVKLWAINHWPFVESPGEFTERLRVTMSRSVTLLAAVRTILIEDPPILSDEYLSRIPFDKLAGEMRRHGATVTPQPGSRQQSPA